MKTLGFLAVSIAFHAAVLLVVRRPAAATTGAPVEIAANDAWAGQTAELPGGGGELVEIEPPARAVEAPPPAPAIVAPPETTPAPEPKPAPKPVVVAPKAKEPVALDPSAAPTTPPPKKTKPRKKKAESAPSTEASADAPEGSSGERASTSRGEGDGRGGHATFGSEGAAGVRDLARAFTRAIPPASQADPIWAKLPAGALAPIDVSIHVSESGKLVTAWEAMTKDPPDAWKHLVDRTIALLGAGTFAVKPGEVGKGTEIFRLKATLSDVEAPDPATGGAVSLKNEFDGKRGKASFTQLGGRHVEIAIEVLKTTD